MASIQTYTCGLQTAHVQYHTALLTSSSGWTSSAFTDHTAAMGYKQHMYSTILPCLPAAQDGYRPPSQTTPLLCSGASFPSAARREEANMHIVGKWCIGCHDLSVDTRIHKHIVQTLCPHPPFPPLSLPSPFSLTLPPYSYSLLFPSTLRGVTVHSSWKVSLSCLASWTTWSRACVLCLVFCNFMRLMQAQG